jgi:DNA-binding response OmpR family regulator
MADKILIVEDEENILISLEFLMQEAGYEHRVARTGHEALELVQSFGPNLVLLDVMLPGIDGFEVCQRIRENRELDGMKIIMLTARGRQAEVSKGMALGADAYVTKPFSTHRLLDDVRRYLAE